MKNMALSDGVMTLPDYHSVVQGVSSLQLPISCAELHGVLCGYLAAGRMRQAKLYLRSILSKRHSEQAQPAAAVLFDIVTISQQQLSNLGFDFELLLPGEDLSLPVRARAFSEWCEGFTQGLTVAGVDFNQLEGDDAQEAVEHITEFAQLDYEALQVNEENERALTEVIEYTRMAVLAIHAETKTHDPQQGTAH
jgi:uncharacterized protein YgfB (UPF0149 family)